MQAVLLSSDLMLISTAQGAADRHGSTLTVAGDVEQALAMCGDEATGLVVIDLRLPGLDVAAFVARVRGAKPQAAKIVACGPHVHKQSLAAAAAAGCDEVITRGEFDGRIHTLLAELTAPAATDRPAEG
jgi:CheY-like chemotaxis protein